MLRTLYWKLISSQQPIPLGMLQGIGNLHSEKRKEHLFHAKLAIGPIQLKVKNMPFAGQDLKEKKEHPEDLFQ